MAKVRGSAEVRSAQPNKGVIIFRLEEISANGISPRGRRGALVTECIGSRGEWLLPRCLF